MRTLFRFLILLVPLCSMLQAHQDAAEEKRKATLATIPKTSLRKLLFFASLYPNTDEGKIALREAFEAFSRDPYKESLSFSPLFAQSATLLATLSEPTLFTKTKTPELSEETLQCVENLGKHLPHKALRGHTAQSLEEVEQLESHEIDLARALLLLEKEISPQNNVPISSIEASLDLLALSVLARVPLEAEPAMKIRELNHVLFDELALRFPPQSEVEAKVQQFSELSTVLFSRRGVCLGASTLYLCLAQRIGLSLSIFTPPGHIFVGHKGASALRAIETTARGIDVPVEEYLGVSLRSLPERSLKEVIGMVAFNRAALAISKKEWEKALSFYTTASRFESDEELSLMIGMTELILGKKRVAQKVAKEALQNPSSHRVEHDLLLLDMSRGFLSKESAEAILETTDADPEHLREHIKKLQDSLKRDPKSFSLPLHLAHSFFASGKPGEALLYLECLASHEEAPASVHFFLAELYENRLNIPAAWKEAKKAFHLARAQGFVPKALQRFILSLHAASPNCEDVLHLVEYTNHE